MAKNSRWMTWVLESSAKSDVTMPWARGTQPNWKKNLAVEAPDLAKVLDRGLHLARLSANAPHETAS